MKKLLLVLCLAAVCQARASSVEVIPPAPHVVVCTRDGLFPRTTLPIRLFIRFYFFRHIQFVW